MADHHENPGIDGLKSRGDLARFILDTVGRHGAVKAQAIGGLKPQFRWARGSTTLNGGGAAEASVSVTHGLEDGHGNATTPEQILLTTNVAQILATAQSRSATTFTLTNRHIDGLAYSADVRTDWIVIG